MMTTACSTATHNGKATKTRRPTGATATARNVLSRPAVGAEPVLRKAYRRHEVVHRLEGEGSQVELLADVLHHAAVVLAGRVDVLRDVGFLALAFADVAPGYEIVLVLGAGEVYEVAWEQERRAGDAHVHLAASL